MLEVLRQRIASHELPPGSRLLEHDLANEFGVSRARVREVFGILEVHSLIERIPNRGAVVLRLDLKQAQELFDIREMLEGLSARLAGEKTAGE
jgi:DNA-binding GntR family transcriptional regulator